MAQPSVISFFKKSKRPATDDISSSRNKVFLLDAEQSNLRTVLSEACRSPKVVFTSGSEGVLEYEPSDEKDLKAPLKRSRLATKLTFDNVVSPTCSKTQTVTPSRVQKNVKRTLLPDKCNTSSRLAQLRASVTMAKLNSGFAKLQEMENKRLGIAQSKVSSLKEFKTIELEVPISPQKMMASPQKTFLSPRKFSGNELMSPKKGESVARKLMLSPTKNAVPAYQRHQGLTESGVPSLILPYNFKCLAEIFRSVDAVSAMLYNRKETITFNKLKPAVQEMLRKNFTESHLAQIKTIYPDAFEFSQEKVRNFGATSKQDKYELVIVPNVAVKSEKVVIDADNVLKSGQESSMNPQVILTRQRMFYNLLLDKIKSKHEEFLLSLDPPLSIPKDKLTRWHANFDIEGMPDVEKAELPQPPNIEKLSSARDVLTKAKSLFNCNTRMERALERLAEAQSKGKSVQSLIDSSNKIDIKAEVKSESSQTEIIPQPVFPINPALKGIPKALLDKIKAKQAAKALEAMTRLPAQDEQALKYGRLPDLARHARNLFVTEKKNVLPLEIILKKLENSYRANLTATELEEHLKLLSQVVPGWIVFHDIRKGVFVKLSKDSDVAKVLKKLEDLAAEKAK